jgi:DNA-binding IclR family transcriptional regulator
VSGDDVRPVPRDPVAAVRDALSRRTSPALPEEIAAETGLPEKTVRRTLGKLVADRDARRAGGGRYTASRHPR